jgi:hypothetical protein
VGCVHHFVGIVGLLVGVHHRLVKHHSQLAVRELNREIVGGFLLRGCIG